ncbi:MAG: ATP-binding protein, partial [Puniceicoccales bacterium]|nr:ATP-binding protein [Puniceicoccales bacterium]
SDDNEELFAEIRKYLRTFHEPLKSCDPYLRFLFLTGIARYVGVSIFSTLNNVTDISLDPRYAAICGYTQAELEHSFSTHIETLATANNELKEQVISRIKTWYNGYSWDGETSVYNPYSTLRFFNIGKFKNFWFETGTPSYLINLLQKKKNLALVLGATPSFTLDTVTEKLSQVDEKILLFQTGYLTIKRIELMGDIEKYTLDFPNAEVRESFTKYFLSGYGNYSIDDTVILHKKLAEQLLANDVTALNETLCSALAWIPYGLIVENEHYYHSLMLLWLRLLGFDIQAEDPTNFGRMDAVWELPEQIIVAEIKYAKPPQPIKKRGRPKKTDANIIIPATKPAVLDKLLAEAFAQITEKRYPEKFKTATTENGTPKKLTALAIACSGKDVKCAIKEIQ